MRERVHYPFSPPTILELQNINIYSHLNISIMEKQVAIDLVKSVIETNLTAAGQVDSWNRNAQGMPLLEGKTYHVKPVNSADDIEVGTIGAGAANAGQRFLSFKTAEETPIGFSAIARKGNGLGLDGDTRQALVADFVKKVGDYMEANPTAQGYPVTIEKLNTRPGQNGQMVIPTFRIA